MEKQLKNIVSSDDRGADEMYVAMEKEAIMEATSLSLVDILPQDVKKYLPKHAKNEQYIEEVFENDTLSPAEAIGLIWGIGVYIHKTKGSSYTSIVQSRASEGSLRCVISSLDPHRGAVFALNAPFAWCTFVEDYFTDASLKVNWGVIYQACGRVGRRGQSYDAKCFVGKHGAEYFHRLLRGEENSSFYPESVALDQVANEWLEGS